MEISSSSRVVNYLQRTSKELGHTPGRPSDEISCSIRVVSFDDSPKYTATSYTWREQYSYLRAGATVVVDIVKAAYRGQEYDMHFPGVEEEVRATKTILCNGKRLSVTANLYEALLSLQRTRPGNGEYWIDAVCMNQRYPTSSRSCLTGSGRDEYGGMTDQLNGDMTERNAQVRMMGRIYQSVDLVLVWLGDCSSKLAQRLPELEALAQSLQGNYPLLSY
ncbi:hypothetical protein RU639_002991 [Aspergillus parasiticus]